MITVLSWLWRQDKARTPYKAEHVNTWAAMVRRNLSMPHRIACVTDMPQGIDPSVHIIQPPGDFEDIETSRWTNGRPRCWRRLAMFRCDAADLFGARIVSMDLDCVVAGPLDPLFDRKDDLVLFKGTAANRPYNGSLMLIRAGCRPDVFDDFSQEAAVASGQEFCGSDQAWLAHKLGWHMPTWDHRDGVYFWGRQYLDARSKLLPRLVFFPGQMKPWNARLFDGFTRLHYHADEEKVAA
jgi:hypothetical protein